MTRRCWHAAGGEFRSGLAEVLKAGIIGDPALFEQLAGIRENKIRNTPYADDAIRNLSTKPDRASSPTRCGSKARIVERDPFEMGDRAWLNLGHTFGHALELLSGYTLRHGEAVALGTIAAAEMSASAGLLRRGAAGTRRAAVERLGLPTRYAFDPAAALAAMGTDKKRRGRSLRFVLIRRIGEVIVADDVPEAAVIAALEHESGSRKQSGVTFSRSRFPHHVFAAAKNCACSPASPRQP